MKKFILILLLTTTGFAQNAIKILKILIRVLNKYLYENKNSLKKTINISKNNLYRYTENI
jgi:hypothetical protein